MKKITIFPFLILFAVSIQSQNSTIKFSFNHLALSVKDVNRSAAFMQPC